MAKRYGTMSGADVAFLRDADLPGLEIRASSYEAVSFPKHTHETYSIGYVEAGQSRVFLRGKNRSLERGEIVLIHPNEVHACNPAPGSEWENRMFFMSPDLLAGAMAEIFGEPNVLPEFSQVVVQDSELLKNLRALLRAVERGDAALQKESLLLLCCAEILKRHAAIRVPEQSEDAPRQVRMAKDWLHENWDTRVTLAALTAAAGGSPYALLRSFRKATGLTPHDYQLQLRIARARKLLAQGNDIANVALATGFTDQSHFTNVFRSVTGATPGQYRRGR